MKGSIHILLLLSLTCILGACKNSEPREKGASRQVESIDELSTEDVDMISAFLGEGNTLPTTASDIRYQRILGIDDALKLRFSIPSEEVTTFTESIELETKVDYRGAYATGDPTWFDTSHLTVTKGGRTKTTTGSIDATIDISESDIATIYIFAFEL